jgi:beta-galactosidase
MCVIATGQVSLADDKTALSSSSRPFDNDWKFNLGDNPGASAVDFNDSAWRQINLPHDWSIEQPFNPNLASGTAFLPAGIGWYRKRFDTPPLDAGQHLNILFDGIYKDAEVWINGHSLGRRPNGFIGYEYELTPFLSTNHKPNILAIRVDHSDYADSRFYTGSGIYRHVWLQTQNAVHLIRWGTFITTPHVSKQSARVNIPSRVVNTDSEPHTVTLISTILDAQGKPVGSAASTHVIKAGAEYRFDKGIKVIYPALWSPENPVLYTVVSQLKSDSISVDESRTSFGIRWFAFDPNKGFFLNGVKTIFKGVCVHQDEGSFGAAVPEQAMQRRLALLKELGCNAIRTSHNPPAPEFLDLCDQMGFLVMDEAFDEWARPKKKWVVGINSGEPSFDGYSKYFKDWSQRDLQAMIQRDRNHPSIILWSIGNEIDYDHDPYYDPTLANYTPDHPSASELVGIAKTLRNAVKEIDPTRPVTAALAHIETSNRTGLAHVLDVVGYNYQEKFYEADHAAHPRRCIIGSENSQTYAAWKPIVDLPYANGQFLWTGFDYLGEARRWPWRGSPAGLFDECGFKKPAFYFRKSLWSDQPVIYLTADPPVDENEAIHRRVGEPNWNWPVAAGTPISVSCYTNCERAELFLNHQSQGTQFLSAWSDHVLHWTIPYAPGTLQAVGHDGTRTLCSFELTTTDPAQSIQLKPETTSISADGQSLCFVEADVVDAQNNLVFDSSNQLNFEIQGPGKILALDSGDLQSHEDFRSNTRRVYNGKCLVIIQSTSKAGSIVLRASGRGLTKDEVTVVSR